MHAACLGPLGAKLQSLPAEEGSLSQRWVGASRGYDLFVAVGEGHADCAMGWFSGMVLVPVAAAGAGLVGLLVKVPSHVTVFVVSLPAMVSLAGVAWSAIRHLTRSLFTRWEALSTPLIIDDLVAVVAGSLAAYFLTTPW